MVIALVPAYNEEKTIGSVVRNLFGHVDRVVVVDDGSSDNTVAIAQDTGAVVLRHNINRGQGAALETGHAYARKHNAVHVVHFDADDQLSVDDIAPALAALKNADADILFGSRVHSINTSIPWSKKYIIRPLGRAVDRLFGVLPLSDTHNGFRILNTRALGMIRITQDRMAHATEIPVLARRHGLRYIEFPVQVTYHEYGQDARGGFRVLYDLCVGVFLKK